MSKLDEYFQEMREKISPYLIGTSEEHPIEICVPYGEWEACGLSTLEMPTLDGIYQNPGDGMICVHWEGDGPDVWSDMDLLDPRVLEDIYNDVKWDAEHNN